MNLSRYFGDSFDLVKLFLLTALKPLGDWQIHPMFTRENTPGDELRERVHRYETLLGAPLVSSEFMDLVNRKRFVQACSEAPNLLLDPDTGICSPTARRSNRHLSPAEVGDIVSARRDKLTAVFDQSFARGRKADDQLTDKLLDFEQRGIHSFAYRSHAHFLFLSKDQSVAAKSRSLLIEAGLPDDRFTPLY